MTGLTIRPDGTFVDSRRVATTSVDIAVPVYNEARALGGCVEALHAFLSESFPFAWRITIVDNASTDDTWRVAEDLAANLPGVYAMHLDEKGRGRALRAAWSSSPADIVAYMDVDLSTGLDALLPLVAPLATGHSDLAIGSRLSPSARTIRGPKRELISRSYNALLRAFFRVGFRDAQCGFKAVRADVARALLPTVHDDAWFFDTELLLLAEHNRLRIHEVPVDWIDDVDTRVDVIRTAVDDVKGLVRVARAKATNGADVELPARRQLAPQHPEAVAASQRARILWQLLSFGVIGLASTILHAGLYFLFRAWWAAPYANLIALILATFANTEANRRLTFNVLDHPVRRHTRAVGLLVLYFALTSGSVWLLGLVVDDPSRRLETSVLLCAALTATTIRFILLRAWVFRRVVRRLRIGRRGSD